MSHVEQLSCQELVELVTEYLEGALEQGEHERFDRHLDDCVNCRTYLEQIRQTIALTGLLTPEQLSPDAERELLHAFGGWQRG